MLNFTPPRRAFVGKPCGRAFVQHCSGRGLAHSAKWCTWAPKCFRFACVRREICKSINVVWLVRGTDEFSAPPLSSYNSSPQFRNKLQRDVGGITPTSVHRIRRPQRPIPATLVPRRAAEQLAGLATEAEWPRGVHVPVGLPMPEEALAEEEESAYLLAKAVFDLREYMRCVGPGRKGAVIPIPPYRRILFRGRRGLSPSGPKM